MPNFVASREEEPLSRELGLRLKWTEVIGSVGTVEYAEGRVLVELGAREQAFDTQVRMLNGRTYRWASDWHSICVLTVDDRRARDLTLVIGVALAPCWAFAGLITSGVPRERVARAAARLGLRVTIEAAERPAAPAPR